MKTHLLSILGLTLASIASLSQDRAAVSATFTEPKEIRYESGRKPKAQTVYRAAEFRGLKIRMLEGETRSLGKDKSDNAFLRTHETGALEFIGRDTQVGVNPDDRDRLPLPSCEALAGHPAIITGNDLFFPSTIRFELSKPARVYAWIDAENKALRQPSAKSAEWHRFLVEAQSRHTLYYRDFAAGINEIRLGPGHFCGAGVSPLDALGDMEKIIAIADTATTPPVLRVRNEHAEPRKVSLTYAWRDPSQSAPTPVTEKEITLQPGMNEFALTATSATEGIVYWLDAKLNERGREWKITGAHGQLPALPRTLRSPIRSYLTART